MDDNTPQTQPQNPAPVVAPETPESLHKRAMTHLHNARDLYLKQLQSKPPTPEHHRVGLGIMAAALAAAALDPTRNKANTAGSAFYDHYKAAKDQRDNETNQQNQSQYQRQGQMAMARSGFETEDAARLLQDKKDMEDQAEQDKQDTRQSKLDDFNETMKKAALDSQEHRAKIAQKARDLEGYRKLLNSPYPFARMLGISGLKSHLVADRPGVQEAGYDPTELEKTLDEASKTATLPSPKDQSAIDLQGARTEQVKGKTAQDKAIGPLKINELKTRTKREQSTIDLNAQKQKNLAQTYEWAPKLLQVRIAKMNSDMERNSAMIAKAQRSGKSIDPNAKWITEYNRSLSGNMKAIQEAIKEQDSVIKTQTPNALLKDQGALDAIGTANKRKGSLQKEFDNARKSAETLGKYIKKKAGIE